jgi:hypothetical protein
VLYHVHFDVADVPTLERRYICDGFEVVARYGYVGREHRSFGPEVGWDELERMGVRLRLVELESGAVNVVVMRGKNEAPRLGQIGWGGSDDEVAAAKARAEHLGLRMRQNPNRILITTGHGFEIELTAPDRHSYDEAARAARSISWLEVACADPAVASSLVSQVVADASADRLRFVEGSGRHASLRAWELSASAYAG